MLRLLFLIVLSAMSSLAFGAEDIPMFFQPADKDVSIYYLGEIFGAGLIPGGAETYLLSDMFQIFNQVCLVVAIIIIIYTMIFGVLETAGQGKVLGEKWSPTWVPIRIMLGMALLVPKAGSGYVLAQSIVMWMAIQGVGAADQLWNKALDYFIEGGAVFAQQDTGVPLSASYMNHTNVSNTYELERVILINATCIEAHNASDSAKLMGKYEIYQTKNPSDGYYDFVNFGDPDAWNDGLNGGNAGRECGHIIVPSFVAETPEQIALMHQTYSDAFYYMARGLSPLAEFLASEKGSDPELWERYFTGTQYEAVAYIEYLNAASHILNPTQEPANANLAKLETLKDYGWILAGNYYMTLTNLGPELTGISLYVNPYDAVKPPPDSTYDQYPQQLENAEYYWELPAGDPRADFAFSQWTDAYNIPGYGDLSGEPIQPPADETAFTYQDLYFIEHSLAGLGSMGGITGATTVGHINEHGELKTEGIRDAGTRDPLYYLQAMTNFGGSRVGDPILYAAKFGGLLTEMAVMMLVIGMAGFIILAGLSAFSGPCMITTPFWATVSMTLIATLAPLIFGMAAFMYVQGALLSVALPLIPFIIFFVAAIGWFIATIEMVVSAPLVAVGLVFPETNQDVWGKAEPAFMMILNLFLRPPLIILGFVAGMILTWVAIELLNTSFYFFIKDAAKIENTMFGWLVVIMAYVGILITVVEKTFGMTTELPNKILQVLGDRTQAQPGAEAMLSAMKQGAEKGAGAAGGFISSAGGVAEKGASTGMEQSAAKASRDKQEKEVKTQGLAGKEGKG